LAPSGKRIVVSSSKKEGGKRGDSPSKFRKGALEKEGSKEKKKKKKKKSKSRAIKTEGRKKKKKAHSLAEGESLS